MPERIVKIRSDKDIEDDLKNTYKIRSNDPSQVDDLAFCYSCNNRLRPKCKLDFKMFSKDECPIGTLENVYCESCDHYEEELCREGYPISAEFIGCPKYDGQKISVILGIKDKKGKWHNFNLTK
jgi:hypothetical protein